MSKYEQIGIGMEIVAPLLEASMQRSSDITDQLMKSNIQSAYRDGFEAGVLEGMKRQGIATREALGVYQEYEPAYMGASFYLRKRVIAPDRFGNTYPYSMLTVDDIRED